MEFGQRALSDFSDPKLSTVLCVEPKVSASCGHLILDYAGQRDHRGERGEQLRPAPRHGVLAYQLGRDAEIEDLVALDRLFADHEGMRFAFVPPA